MSGNENDRKIDFPLCELGLEVQAAQARHPHVNDQAAWVGRLLLAQELRGGSEDVDLQPDRAEKVREPGAHDRIVIDHTNDRRTLRVAEHDRQLG